MKPKYGSPISFNFVYIIGSAKDCKQGAIDSQTRLNHMRDISLLSLFVEILQGLAGAFLMTRKIKITSSCDAFQALARQKGI